MARKNLHICICLLNNLLKNTTLPTSYFVRGYSSDGRAPALQAGGRRFDPVILHHYLLVTKRKHRRGVDGVCVWPSQDERKSSAVL